MLEQQGQSAPSMDQTFKVVSYLIVSFINTRKSSLIHAGERRKPFII